MGNKKEKKLVKSEKGSQRSNIKIIVISEGGKFLNDKEQEISKETIQ